MDQGVCYTVTDMHSSGVLEPYTNQVTHIVDINEGHGQGLQKQEVKNWQNESFSLLKHLRDNHL